jgi:hypothetical protein
MIEAGAPNNLLEGTRENLRAPQQDVRREDESKI